MTERSGNPVMLVFGSRSDVPPHVVREFINSLPSHYVVMTGGARGVDLVATEAALERWSRGELAGVEVFPAQWAAFGRGAGPERNVRMGLLATLGVGFRANGRSTGTDHMGALLNRAGKLVELLLDPWVSLCDACWYEGLGVAGACCKSIQALVSEAKEAKG